MIIVNDKSGKWNNVECSIDKQPDFSIRDIDEFYADEEDLKYIMDNIAGIPIPNPPEDVPLPDYFVWYGDIARTIAGNIWEI